MNYKLLRVFGLKCAIIVACVTIAWQSKDALVYHTRGLCAPLQLGEVTGLWPAHMTPNDYVCVEGITEHRGMRQRIARSMMQGPEDLWYFRLLGSRGIFVEVPADANAFAPAQRVQICGRVIDPFADRLYRPLLQAYVTTFRAHLEPPIRLIQHNVEPGQRMGSYVLLICVLLGVSMWQVWTLIRLGRQHRVQTRRSGVHNASYAPPTKPFKSF